MIKSLRWRLQIWHALVLMAVVVSFGSAVYQLQWQARLQQVDAGLDWAADVLTARLRRSFPRAPMWPWGGGGRRTPFERNQGDHPADAIYPENLRPEWLAGERNPGPPPGGGRFEPDRRPPGEPGRNRPPEPGNRFSDPVNRPPEPGPRPPDGGGNRGPRPPFQLEIPSEVLILFERDYGDNLYFYIWDHDGRLVKRTESAPEVRFPDLKPTTEGLPTRAIRSRDHLRETIHVSSSGINLLVGRHLDPEIQAQHTFGFWLIGVGTLVVVVGLVGGWWMSGRAIYPIVVMTRTAATISAQNLSERISLKETDSELGQLALVLNQTFDRLQAAFEQQVRFTADASHELRTPLAVILARTELALSRVRGADDYRAALEANRRAAQRMKALLDGLLWLARFDAGEATDLRELVRLDEIALECLELVRLLAEPKQIQFDRRLLAVTVRGNRERLSQVITNLLTNAIRYNHPQGRVVVEVFPDGASAVLRVVDSGIGIPSTALPHIFERFFRVDEARSRDDGGSGLGLAICRTIVDLHQGTITAQSQLESGTAIEVRLPLA